MNPPGRQCLPPRYFCLKDQDAFLRELGHYLYDVVDKQLGRDVERFSDDLANHTAARGRELYDLRRAYDELEDETFAEQFRAPPVDPFMREEPEETET